MRRLLVLSFAILSTVFYTTDAKAETAYDRVLKTQTIRCGYNYYEPVLWRDNKTSEMKGIFVDYMNAISKATNLKIEWAAEVGWGDVSTALKTKKIDAMCAGKWEDAKDGVYISYTTPVFFNSIEAYVRADDHRFDKDFSLINDPKVKIVSLEGGAAQDIKEEDFPKATSVSLSIMQTESDQLLNVSTGKGDVAFSNAGTGTGFMKANPGKIRPLNSSNPLRVYGVTIAVDIQEQELLSVLNSATNQLLNSGHIDRILNNYEKDYPGSFVRVAKPYAVPRP